MWTDTHKRSGRQCFQYGYTNFQKKGYRFASENEFFHASLKNRNAKLAQLVNHVDTKHTAYLEAEPTAYLGIFTDLDSNQENQRYYFQRSGRILERNAGYAQGYVQDVAKENDEAFFREPFLQLLWVPFRTGQELVQLPSEDCDRYFPDVTVDAFHLEQNPIKLEQGLLLRILEELLKGHRLVLHIDQQGDQAPQYSLGVLRHIYECLPYAMRRNCGFATNVAPERFSTNIDADRLPGAVQLCLVDGDVELPGRVSGFTVLEMGETYPVADENREFLQMLTVDSDTRRNFFEMVQENCRIASETKAGAFTEEETVFVNELKDAINHSMKVGCTGCGYCQPCPYGVDIPGAFRCYNVRYTDNFFTGMREYLMCTTFRAERTNASLCRQCGKCGQHCPQGIAVRKELKQVVRHMENPVYKVIAFFAKDMFKK